MNLDDFRCFRQRRDRRSQKTEMIRAHARARARCFEGLRSPPGAPLFVEGAIIAFGGTCNLSPYYGRVDNIVAIMFAPPANRPVHIGSRLPGRPFMYYVRLLARSLSRSSRPSFAIVPSDPITNYQEHAVQRCRVSRRQRFSPESRVYAPDSS